MFLQIIQAGQAAASSSFLQGVTIIRIKDTEKRRKLASIAGNQSYIQTAAEFLIFCADLNRSMKCCKIHHEVPTKGYTEQFIIATVDTALFAQNVVVAAESAGLGICYIGAIRNNPREVTQLLKLPEHVYPVFGLCIGYPAQDPEIKPRLPVSVVLKDDAYQVEGEISQIRAYDQLMKNYYSSRSSNLNHSLTASKRKTQSWSEQMSSLLSKEKRDHMRDFVREQGFEMK